jgi:hypothetical protein
MTKGNYLNKIFSQRSQCNLRLLKKKQFIKYELLFYLKLENSYSFPPFSPTNFCSSFLNITLKVVRLP